MKLEATFSDGSKWYCEAPTKLALRMFHKKVLDLCSEEADAVTWSGDGADALELPEKEGTV